MKKRITTEFEWDETKNAENCSKHGVTFETAIHVFKDNQIIILEDITHSGTEKRYFAIGCVFDPAKSRTRVITVRFTYRDNRIRIFGAGFWRNGGKMYENENYKN